MKKQNANALLKCLTFDVDISLYPSLILISIEACITISLGLYNKSDITIRKTPQAELYFIMFHISRPVLEQTPYWTVFR